MISILQSVEAVIVAVLIVLISVVGLVALTLISLSSDVYHSVSEGIDRLPVIDKILESVRRNRR